MFSELVISADDATVVLVESGMGEFMATCVAPTASAILCHNDFIASEFTGCVAMRLFHGAEEKALCGRRSIGL
jgi:hypothetical protein